MDMTDYDFVDYYVVCDSVGHWKVGVNIEHVVFDDDEPYHCNYRFTKNHKVDWWKGLFLMGKRGNRVCQYESQGWNTDMISSFQNSKSISQNWWVVIEVWNS